MKEKQKDILPSLTPLLYTLLICLFMNALLIMGGASYMRDFGGHPSLKQTLVLVSGLISMAGSVTVFVVLFRRASSKRLVMPPRVAFYGLLLRTGIDREQLLRDAQRSVEDLYLEVYRGEDLEDLEELVRLEIRKFFRKHASHKPAVVPLVVEV